MAESRIEKAARETSERLATKGLLGQGTVEQRSSAAHVVSGAIEASVREAANLYCAQMDCAGSHTSECCYELILRHFGLGVFGE